MGTEATEQPMSKEETEQCNVLVDEIARLEKQLLNVNELRTNVDRQLKTDDPEASVRAHIKLLHEYNAIREVGIGLMDLVADQRGVRAVDVRGEYGITEDD